MSALLIPIPCSPAISLHCHLIPPPLLCRTPKQTSPCHPPLRMDHSEVSLLPHQISDPVPRRSPQYCPRCNLVLGFSLGEAHVFTSSDLLPLKSITLPGLCPLPLLLCDTECHLINQACGKIQEEGLSAANCHPAYRRLQSHKYSTLYSSPHQNYKKQGVEVKYRTISRANRLSLM